MINVYWDAAAAIVFFWCGAVASISFLEAWIKFTAPGVTMPVGLSIGRLVFSALNKVEWVLLAGSVACGIAASLGWGAGGSWRGGGGTGAGWWPGGGWVLVAGVMLLVETFWLLPVLDKRAVIRMEGQEPPASSVHLLFVAAEVIKAGSLVLAGIGFLKLM